jgi:hypothetical protein
MSNLSSPKQKSDALTHELAALSRGEVSSWSQIGNILIEVDQSGYWRNEATSFTDWLKHRADKFKLHESTLWRYLTAGRYYIQLRKTLTERNVLCPPLESLSGDVSPENLELLSKITRVAPDDALQRLTERVIGASITRAELRATWQAYRPVLGGRTARGVSPPHINLADRDQVDSLLQATVLTALSAGGSAWTGIEKLEICRLFTNVRPEYAGPLPSCEIDVVAMVREHEKSPLKIHGIEIIGSFNRQEKSKFVAMAPFCDLLWVATPDYADCMCKADVPDFVGIIRATESALRVERPARASKFLGTELLPMTKGLLLKTLNR